LAGLVRMHIMEDIELWNISRGRICRAGAQEIFNIVGRVRTFKYGDRLFYRLNGGEEREAFVFSGQGDCRRLMNEGDFNIDTIHERELKRDNHLCFRLEKTDRRQKRSEIRFRVCLNEGSRPEFRLIPGQIDDAHEAGQVVDGKWRVGRDETGASFLEIRPEDSGYDRIILFGSRKWKSAYSVYARFRITAWTGLRDHGIGFAFRWSPHACGRGKNLPSRWTSGIGMYYFPRNLPRPGLSVTYGVDVHYDEKSRYVGEHVLAQGFFSPWRWFLGSIQSNLLRFRYPLSQLVPGEAYCMRMIAAPDAHTLTVWKEGKREPPPQVRARRPHEWLKRGCAGIIAHHCALKVYEFEVE